MEDKIKQLSTHETCREKLPVFYGSREKEGALHGIIEVVMNSIDEISNNFETGEITFQQYADSTISIEDTGRGIPLDGETDGKPNYELLFDTLFAGTNYENFEKGKATTGTNGVGTCVLNHTSTKFQVFSCRNGKLTSVKYSNGVLEEVETIDNADSSHGTTFTFKLDPEVYTVTEFATDELRDIINILAGATPNITYTFEYQSKETLEWSSEVIHYDNTLDYVTNNFTSKLTEHIPFAPKTYESEVRGSDIKETNICEAIISLSTEPVQQTFLNRTFLKEHGTIYDGIVAGILKVFEKKTKKKLTKQDVEMSFNIFGNILSTNVDFANQTKFSTRKGLYKTLMTNYIAENLQVLECEQPKIFSTMLKHLENINSFNTKNTESMRKMKKKLSENVGGINGKVEGLIDCKEHGENAELFICEGQSAKGSCVDARIAKNQAIFAIRGKILSCLKADYNTIANNEIVTNIFKILGCGIEVDDKRLKDFSSFNKNNLRYGKIILTADADPDGDTICCLLLTMFYRLAPTLIKDGHIYIARTPLFEIKLKNDEILYANNDKERDDIIASNKDNIQKILRNKGLIN